MLVCDVCHRIIPETRDVCAECGTPAPPAPGRCPDPVALVSCVADVGEGTSWLPDRDQVIFALSEGEVVAVGRRLPLTTPCPVGLLVFVRLSARIALPNLPTAAGVVRGSMNVRVVDAASLSRMDPRALAGGGLERTLAERAAAALANEPFDEQLAARVGALLSTEEYVVELSDLALASDA